MKMSSRLALFVLLGGVVLSLAAGCASMDQTRKKDAAIVLPPPIDQSQYIFHRVMEGETFAGIAKWYAGDEAVLYRLMEENPGLDPVKLTKGDIVKVPVSLAVIHSEQPDHSTQPQKPQKTVRKRSGKATRAASPLPPNAPPEVFGPK